MTQRIRLSALLAVVLAAAIAVATVWAPWAVSAPPSCEQPPQITSPNVHDSNRPIVFVHGWDGRSANMHPIGDYVEKNPGLSPRDFFYFDYSSHNTDWAARPTVAGCLAAYITAISKSYKAAGGDGKVIVIAHSMGGLVIRFASSSQFVSSPIGSDLAGVITIDTPSLGSPFGDQALARAAQAAPLVGGGHPTSLFHAPAGSDASICLAPHHPPANQLPSGCALAPYLPAGIPITQLAGDMVVNRTFFGVHLYSVDLGTDGPVPIDSAHGYVNSGPGGHAPSGTQASDQPTVSCTVDFDQVAQLASGEGAVNSGLTGAFSGIGDLLSPTIFTDARALDSLQSGQTGSQLLGFLLAAYTTAPCSHSGMLTDSQSLSDIASAVKNDLAHPANAVSMGSGGSLSSSSSCADWYAASFAQRSAFASTVSPGVQLDKPVPTEPSQRAAFMYGFTSGGCDRAKDRGLDPAAVTLQAVLDGDYVQGSPSTATGPTTTPTGSPFAGQVSVSDGSGYTFAIAYSLNIAQTPMKNVTNDQPGYASVQLRASGSLQVTNTTSEGRRVPDTFESLGNYFTFSELFRANRPVCKVNSQGSGGPLETVNLTQPQGTYCVMNAYDENGPLEALSLPAGSSLTYSGSPLPDPQNPGSQSTVLSGIPENKYPQVAVDLQAGPDIYAITQPNNQGGSLRVPECATTGGLSINADAVLIVAASPNVNC